MPLLLIAVAWLLLDRLVKHLVVVRMVEGDAITVIPHFFRINYIRNAGGAWSIFEHQTWLFVTVSSVVSLVILYMAFRPEGKRWATALALGLIMGGALGNLWDRLATGLVVDMFSFTFGTYQFPVFNVADIGIDVGAVILIISLLLAESREKRSKKGDAA